MAELKTSDVEWRNANKTNNNTDTNKENKNNEYGIKLNAYKADKTNKPGYPNNFDEEASLQRLLRANGIYRRSDFDDFNSFYVFPRNDPFKMFGTTREYVFITKPDLHIFGKENSNYNTGKAENIKDTSVLNPSLDLVPFFKDLHQRGYKDTVLKSLCYSADPSNPFVNILSNYKTAVLDLSDISVNSEETAANIYNTRMYYRKPSDSEDEVYDFNMEFKDNKYLDCYLWFKAYDIYERLKYQGKVYPTDTNYIQHKILSDQMTVFKFIVADDNETILHWTCLWGCYPTAVPRATFSDLPTDGQLKFTVNWRATFQSDMDPLIIEHFNLLCNLYIDNNANSITPLPIYDNDPAVLKVTGEKAVIPYIIPAYNMKNTNIDGHKMYILKWMIKTDELNKSSSVGKIKNNNNATKLTTEESRIREQMKNRRGTN